MFFVLILVEGERRALNVFIFYFFYTDFSYFLLIFEKKKSRNDVISAPLTAIANQALMEYHIEKNWKLKDWNDKIES